MYACLHIQLLSPWALVGAKKDKFLSQSNNNPIIRVLDTQKKALNWYFIRETGYRVILRLETANSFGPLCPCSSELLRDLRFVHQNIITAVALMIT